MKRFIVLLATVIFLAGATSVYAIPTLWIDDPNDSNAPLIITDGGFGDLSPVAGAVQFSGAVGPVWVINMVGGITKPLQGDAVNAYMDITSQNKSINGGTIYVWFTETDFLPGPSGLFSADLNLGGTVAAGGEAIFGWSLSPDNAQTVLGGPGRIGLTPYLGPGSFSWSGIGSASGLTNPYSLALGANIFHDNAGTTSYDQELTQVPEPISLLLLGLGLVGLAGIRRKFKS